jgi:uncharacterized membrane protein
MSGTGAGRGTDRRLAHGLGYFSLGLGVAQVAAPSFVDQLAGVEVREVDRLVTRLVGARELAAAGGLLTDRGPAGWLWARVAGDVMDLAVLGMASQCRRNRRPRVLAAAAAVLGITALDLLGAVRHTRRSERSAGAARLRARTATTVNRPTEEVYAYWRDLERLPTFMWHLESVRTNGNGRSHWVAKGPRSRVEWDAELVEDRPGERIAWRSLPGATVDNRGSVVFRPAPGGRGTEVALELEYSPPGGRLGGTVAKLFGEDPTQQVRDDLRRFKQVVETGEVIRSEGSPEGAVASAQLRQQPAQPHAVEEGSRP